MTAEESYNYWTVWNSLQLTWQTQRSGMWFRQF